MSGSRLLCFSMPGDSELGDRQVLALSGVAGSNDGRRTPSATGRRHRPVAVKHGGARIAIQCKARSGGGSVTTKQIQQFAGAAPAAVFAERWMVAEAHRSAATEDAAAVAAVTFVDFEAALADALEDAQEQAATEPDPRTAMQQEAVAACVQALRAVLPEHRDRWLGSNPADWMPRDAARATLVLPCGTGKTRVSMRIMSELSGPGDLGVVLVPSIALIAQVRREYLSHIVRPVRTLAVCSDATAGHVNIERDPDLAADPTRDTGQIRAADVGCQVAQSAKAVADWLHAGADSTDLRIIFSTYQSAHHTADALLAKHQFGAGPDFGRGAPDGPGAAGEESATSGAAAGVHAVSRPGGVSGSVPAVPDGDAPRLRCEQREGRPS